MCKLFLGRDTVSIDTSRPTEDLCQKKTYKANSKNCKPKVNCIILMFVHTIILSKT
jgi:hypothetical protein